MKSIVIIVVITFAVVYFVLMKYGSILNNYKNNVTKHMGRVEEIK